MPTKAPDRTSAPEGRRIARWHSALLASGFASTRRVAASAQPIFIKMGDCITNFIFSDTQKHAQQVSSCARLLI